MQRADGKWEQHCLRCGKSWWSKKENPKECNYCRSAVYFKPIGTENIPIEKYIEIPKVDHTESKTLPFIGAKCPYCKGTTGLDNFRSVAFCYSCDATFSITSGRFLGVLAGIGVR